MFKIIKEDKILGTVATPTWVKLQNNGCFGLCTEEDAHGVVVNSVVYHITGKPELPGHDTVVVAQIDEIAYQQEQTSAQEAERLQMNAALAAASDRLDAQATYTAMMTDTLMEG